MSSSLMVSMAMPLRLTFQKNANEGFFKTLPRRPSKFVVKASSLNEKAMAAAGVVLSASMVVPDIARAADIVTASSSLPENLLLIVAVLTAIAATLIAISILERDPFNRTYFPSDFLFGAGSSAYQIEGAWNRDGKAPSIWDTFCHEYPEKIRGHANGDVAIDFYDRYKDDLKLAKSEGLDVFRFSIAWSRILSKKNTRILGENKVNLAGIDFYNRVIDEAIAQGLKPSITLFHWDVPQDLEDEYVGFLNPRIIDDYLFYVDTCFKNFGDRVKQWTTMNEPYTFAITGYVYGTAAPGHCYWGQPAGNYEEPYIVAHNILRAHATAYNLYKENYKAKQNGEVGIILNSNWFVPYSGKDDGSTKKAIDFMLGWFLNPVVYGDYPEDMRKYLDETYPEVKFTDPEKKALKGSLDFLGVNYYSSNYSCYQKLAPPTMSNSENMIRDESIELLPIAPSTTANTIPPAPQIYKTCTRDGIPLGPRVGTEWNCIVPWGLTALLLYIKEHYNHPTIYITECGVSSLNADTVKEGVDDTVRVNFFEDHIMATYMAYKLGVNVKGFYAWSLHDNFEWWCGYEERYGINFVDFNDDLKRYPKKSARWFKEFLGKPFYDYIQQLLLLG